MCGPQPCAAHRPRNCRRPHLLHQHLVAAVPPCLLAHERHSGGVAARGPWCVARSAAARAPPSTLSCRCRRPRAREHPMQRRREETSGIKRAARRSTARRGLHRSKLPTSGNEATQVISLPLNKTGRTRAPFIGSGGGAERRAMPHALASQGLAHLCEDDAAAAGAQDSTGYCPPGSSVLSRCSGAGKSWPPSKR